MACVGHVMRDYVRGSVSIYFGIRAASLEWQSSSYRPIWEKGRVGTNYEKRMS